MYAEAGLVFPYYFQSFSQEVEDLCRINETNVTSNPVQTSIVSEYDLGGEGDLFKAPEPIIEEPELELDPMAAAMSVISNSEDAISTETIRVTDIESIQSEHLLSEVFYECKKDLLAKSAVGEPFAEASSDVKVPAIQTEGGLNVEKEQLISEVLMQKSVSSGSLSSVERVKGGGSGAVRPMFLDFQTMDLGAALGLRRSYSEGDIQALGISNTSLVRFPFDPMPTLGNFTIEERKQKLSRYRKKKSKRNFGRKIKYACRKALADNQPRVRGRFAKAEEAQVSRVLK